jgi:hypothetical protein
VTPLAPGSWDYFCLDQVCYHERWLTILWDKTGTRYGKGKGLRVFADGKEIAAADSLQRVTADLVPARAGEPRSDTGSAWQKVHGGLEQIGVGVHAGLDLGCE